MANDKKHAHAAPAQEPAPLPPAPHGPTLRTFRVKHPDCARLDIEARDEADAVRKYRKVAGILKSEHDTEVLSDPLPEVAAPEPTPAAE